MALHSVRLLIRGSLSVVAVPQHARRGCITLSDDLTFGILSPRLFSLAPPAKRHWNASRKAEDAREIRLLAPRFPDAERWVADPMVPCVLCSCPVRPLWWIEPSLLLGYHPGRTGGQKSKNLRWSRAFDPFGFRTHVGDCFAFGVSPNSSTRSILPPIFCASQASCTNIRGDIRSMRSRVLPLYRVTEGSDRRSEFSVSSPCAEVFCGLSRLVVTD